MHLDNTKVFDTLSWRRFHFEIPNGKGREITLQGARYLQGLGPCRPRAAAVTARQLSTHDTAPKSAAPSAYPQLPLHTSQSHPAVTGTTAPSLRRSPAIVEPSMADGASITK